MFTVDGTIDTIEVLKVKITKLIDDVNSSQFGEAQAQLSSASCRSSVRETLLDARRGTVTHRATNYQRQKKGLINAKSSK